jgi:hypothetical protein
MAHDAQLGIPAGPAVQFEGTWQALQFETCTTVRRFTTGDPSTEK